MTENNMEWDEFNKSCDSDEKGNFEVTFSWQGESDLEVEAHSGIPKFKTSCQCTAAPVFDWTKKTMHVKGQVPPYNILPGQPKTKILRKSLTLFKQNPEGVGYVKHYVFNIGIIQKGVLKVG